MTTLKDVAKLAGVTVTTVSRVLNNRGYISTDTRGKVMSAMKALDYQPNELARSLIFQRSRIIGVIVPSIAIPFRTLGQCARVRGSQARLQNPPGQFAPR